MPRITCPHCRNVCRLDYQSNDRFVTCDKCNGIFEYEVPKAVKPVQQEGPALHVPAIPPMPSPAPARLIPRRKTIWIAATVVLLAANLAFGVLAQQSERWEYSVVSADGCRFESEMNTHGNLGWEIV